MILAGLTIALNTCLAQQKVHIEGRLPVVTEDAKLYLFYKKGFEEREIIDSLILRNRDFKFDLLLREPSLVKMVYNGQKDQSLTQLMAESHVVDAIGFMADTGTVRLTFEDSFRKFNASEASPLFSDFRALNRLTTNIPRERIDSLNNVFSDTSSEAYQIAVQQVLQKNSEELVEFLNRHMNSYTGLLTMDYLMNALPQLIPQLSSTLQQYYSDELQQTGLGRYLLAGFRQYADIPLD